MTALDWGIVAVVAVVFRGGVRRGFLVGALALLGFGAGVLLALAVGLELVPASIPVAPGLLVLVAGLLGSAVATAVGSALRPRGRRNAARGRPGRSAVVALDRMLGGLLAGAVALAVAWAAGAAVLQLSPPREVREAVRGSLVLGQLNAALPPASPIIDALPRFDAFPRLQGPSADVSEPAPGIARVPDVRAARASVVRVMGDACGGLVRGSGWIAGDGLVVTNAHVIAGQDAPRVQLDGEGPALDAVPVAMDRRIDVAVLRVANLRGRVLRLAADADPGTPVAMLGYPGGGPYRARAARLGATRTVAARERSGEMIAPRSITMFRGRARPGNSGGPLVDGDGEVAGTVFGAGIGKTSGTGFAVRNDSVRRALAGVGEPIATGACP